MQPAQNNYPVSDVVVGSVIMGGIWTGIGLWASKVCNFSPVFALVLGIEGVAHVALEGVIEEIAQKKNLADYHITLIQVAVNALIATAATVVLAVLGIFPPECIAITATTGGLLFLFGLGRAAYQYHKSQNGVQQAVVQNP